MMTGLKEYAESLGYSQAVLALAWAIANKQVSSCILGFSRVSQIDENMKALELLKKWTPEIEKKVREILDNEPVFGMSYSTRGPLTNPRDQYTMK